MHCRKYGRLLKRRPWQGCLLILLLAFPAKLDAYIDPGSGSMFLQALVGGLLAASAALRFYWKRIGAWIRGGSDDKPENP